jgi:hypothetical protein
LRDLGEPALPEARNAGALPREPRAGWPEELERYERLYRRHAHLGKEQTKPLREQVNALAKEHGVRDRRNVRLEPEPPVILEQLALAVRVDSPGF